MVNPSKFAFGSDVSRPRTHQPELGCGTPQCVETVTGLKNDMKREEGDEQSTTWMAHLEQAGSLAEYSAAPVSCRLLRFNRFPVPQDNFVPVATSSNCLVGC